MTPYNFWQFWQPPIIKRFNTRAVMLSSQNTWPSPVLLPYDNGSNLPTLYAQLNFTHMQIPKKKKIQSSCRPFFHFCDLRALNVGEIDPGHPRLHFMDDHLPVSVPPDLFPHDGVKLTDLLNRLRDVRAPSWLKRGYIIILITVIMIIITVIMIIITIIKQYW